MCKTHTPKKKQTTYLYLQKAMTAHGSVAGTVAFVCGSVSEAVAPLFQHVEALGVPNVRLQPHILSLATVELKQ